MFFVSFVILIDSSSSAAPPEAEKTRAVKTQEAFQSRHAFNFHEG